MADGVNLSGPTGIGPIGLPPAKATQPGKEAGTSFKDILFEKINEVNGLQKDAETAMMKFAGGETQNVTEVMVAVQKADLAFKTLMQIRNKLFEAYQEINQLRI